MRHPRQVPPSVTKRLLPPASQPSSSFAPSPFCCSRVGRLRFKGDSILFQRQMCYPLLCVVVSLCSRSRSLGCSGEKATVARTLARQPPTPPRSQPQIKFVLHFCSVSPSQCLAFTARATLNVECGQDCEYFALENAGLSIRHSGKCVLN